MSTYICKCGRAYRSVTGMIYAVRQQPDGLYRIMCRYANTAWALATSPQLSAPCRCAESLQEVLDACAARTGWKEFKIECEEKNPTAAPTPDAAATAAAPAAEQEETLTTSESAEDASMCKASTSGAAAEENLSGQPCPADAVPAIENPSNAATACSGAEPPAFDYSGLDRQTSTDLHLAEREYTAGKRLAEMGLRRMADGVAIAHEVLCGPVVPTWDNGNHEDGACPTLGRARNNQYSEDTFRRWCTSVGVSRSAAYRLLQVSTLFDQSSPNQQKVLAELAPSLLYAAAKPSAPAELVQAVKDGDITTHKQYQELLAQLKAKEQALAAKDNAMQQAQEKAEQYHVQVNELTESLSAAHQIRDNAQSRAAKAEAERDAARQQAVDQAARIQELEARPVEVVGASPEDIAKWRAEGRDMAQRELQKELRQARKDAETQRKRAETAEEDAEQNAQEAHDYAMQLGQLRQELESADDVRKVRQTVEACEQLLRPLILDITAMDSEQYTTAMNCLAALGDKLMWATQNDAWPTEDWPDDEWEEDEE